MLERLGRVEEAFANYRLAILFPARESRHHCGHGRAFYKLGRYEEVQQPYARQKEEEMVMNIFSCCRLFNPSTVRSMDGQGQRITSKVEGESISL